MGLFDNDPKFQQLKAIRESGYTGWLDQDNNPVDDLDAWIADQTKRK
ncbi:hypothetical protein ABGB12_34855 [Actinocorallia sp. B10E7]